MAFVQDLVFNRLILLRDKKVVGVFVHFSVRHFSNKDDGFSSINLVGNSWFAVARVYLESSMVEILRRKSTLKEHFKYLYHTNIEI
jgi:hypothetical protein